MGMSVVTIFEILHHVAMLFVRTGAKSLGIVRRTIIIPNKTTTEIDGLGNRSEIKPKKSLEEHLESVNNQRRQLSSTNQGFIKQSVFYFNIIQELKLLQNKKGQKNLGYPRKKQSFYREKDCFFLGYPKFFWPFLF